MVGLQYSTEPEGPLSITTTGYDFNVSQTLGIHMGVFNGEFCCINLVSDHLGGPWIDFKPTAKHGTQYADRHGRIDMLWIVIMEHFNFLQIIVYDMYSLVMDTLELEQVVRHFL